MKLPHAVFAGFFCPIESKIGPVHGFERVMVAFREKACANRYGYRYFPAFILISVGRTGIHDRFPEFFTDHIGSFRGKSGTNDEEFFSTPADEFVA